MKVILQRQNVKCSINMQNMKAPGTDGLPIEFYKIFWNEISTVQ